MRELGHNLTDRQTDRQTGNVAILPMYPVSFLIVKDFVLKANIEKFSETEFEQFRKYSASSTTSLFGIRVSGGFTHESYAGHSEVNNGATTLYIRTPGPQVIGWFSEMTGKDESTPYASLSKSEEFNQIIDELKAYQEKLNKITDISEGDDYASGVTTIPLPV